MLLRWVSVMRPKCQIQPGHSCCAASHTYSRCWPLHSQEIGITVSSERRRQLYHYEGCPFCHLVRDVIDELGLEVELRDTLRNPAFRQELFEVRGRGTVPVLQLTDREGEVRWMPESRDIVRYLRQTYGSG